MTWQVLDKQPWLARGEGFVTDEGSKASYIASKLIC